MNTSQEKLFYSINEERYRFSTIQNIVILLGTIVIAVLLNFYYIKIIRGNYNYITFIIEIPIILGIIWLITHSKEGFDREVLGDIANRVNSLNDDINHIMEDEKNLEFNRSLSYLVDRIILNPKFINDISFNILYNNVQDQLEKESGMDYKLDLDDLGYEKELEKHKAETRKKLSEEMERQYQKIKNEGVDDEFSKRSHKTVEEDMEYSTFDDFDKNWKENNYYYYNKKKYKKVYRDFDEFDKEWKKSQGQSQNSNRQGERKQERKYSSCNSDIYFFKGCTTADELKKRKRELLKQYHPDSFKDEKKKAMCEEICKKINSEYTELEKKIAV